MNKLALTVITLLFVANGFSQQTGNFTITTDPSSAKVTLSEFPDIEKTSPATFSHYKAILYQVRIKKRNYRTIDTTIHCQPGKELDFHFPLIPKTGTANIVSYPSGAKVFVNHQQVGVTPLSDFPVPCGTNVITLINTDGVSYQQTYVVDEDLPLIISHDFNTVKTPANKAYSTPVNSNMNTTEYEDTVNNSSKETYGGFGAVGFYTMLGSNGAEGTAYRYGSDLFGYLRVWGESNKKSDIKGFGLEGILPLDLDKAALYVKGGLVSRSFEPLNSSNSKNITFVTLGGGLCIKPSPHFQIFGEFEFGMYDEDENQETVDLWKDKYDDFSSGGAWIGIRIAF
jgi:hypothetical protein